MPKKISFFKKVIWSTIVVTILSGLVTASVFYEKIYRPNVAMDYLEEAYIYIPTGATFDDVLQLLSDKRMLDNISSFSWVAKQKKYTRSIKPGRYLIKNSMSNNELVSLLRSGRQTPVNVVFNNLRTKEEFAARIAQQLELDSLEILEAMLKPAFLSSVGLNTDNITSLFIPNTYEFYWDTSVDDFLARMSSEHHHFWNEQRKTKAQKIRLKPEEVSSLASIVEKETIKRDEQATVAGLYLNRLKKGMKLQSDPTVIYALGDFNIKRVLRKDLKVDSPYNTYRNKGLPPGPICIPSIRAIDAVLNYEIHDYIFMCAKDDFSGYHNFAKTGVEHTLNARKYRAALNKRGIKR